MTSKPTPTPSDESHLNTMTPIHNTHISRMLYLRSDQAIQSYGPTDKVWEISPINTRGKYHNLVIRSLQIMHLFPNVKTDMTLNTGTQTVTIPAGNYMPGQLANYLNELLISEVDTVCYDQQLCIFRFSPSLNLVSDGTTAQSILGFKPGVDYTGVTESVLPVQLSGPSRIIVETNLQLYNIPISGRLGVFPITKSYGMTLEYNNFSTTHSHLCMDQHFQHIHIRLVDENGDLLQGYDEIPWDILISFEPVDNPGFQNFIGE